MILIITASASRACGPTARYGKQQNNPDVP
jgi:hypothetical protein